MKKARIYISLCFILALVNFGYAQDENPAGEAVEPQESVQEAPAGDAPDTLPQVPESADAAQEEALKKVSETAGPAKAKTSDVSSGSSKTANTISTITIVGNKLISTSTILSKIKTRANQPYFPQVAKDDIKRLFDTGFFDDVVIEPKETPAGTEVVITVTEKPIVEKIDITGMRMVRKDLMLEKFIKTKSGQYLDYNRLREDTEELIRQYQKRGYSQVVIDYKVDADEETHKATVTFVVDEQMRVRIKRVYIQGNEKLSKKEILRVMKTRAARIFHAGFFKEGEFQDDLERIKILYIREGFPDMVLDSKVEHDEKGFMYVTIIINEGKQYTVGKVQVVGNENFTSEQLLGAMEHVKADGIFSELAMQEDKFNLRNYYLSRGFLFVQIDDSASIDPQTGKADIVYTIKENNIVYVDKINITGNTKTKDKVIRREIRLKPGERFDGVKLQRSKERLENLQYFEEVVFDTQPGSAPDKENLVVDVKETQTGAFSFGGGYSTVDELIGFIEVEQKNFDIANFPYFTGGGQDLTLRWETGSLRENFLLSFTEPWFFDHPVSFGFDAFMTEHDKEVDVGYPYNEQRTGGALRLGKELNEYLHGGVTYRIEEVDISEVDESVSNELKKEAGTNTLSTLEFGLTHDTLDSKINPMRGHVMTGNLGVTGGPFGGDKDFFRLYTTLTKYFSFFERSVIEAKFRGGGLLTFDDTTDIPIYERYYAGGTYTIRGYNERKVGPIDPVSEDPIGGEATAIFNLEYTFALNEFLKLATFFDTGNVWRKVEDFGSGDLKSGVGFGVRVKTPVGPVKLDYGFPLNNEPGEGDKEGKFHFSMSRTF